jgi:hypothetical protein
VSMQPLDERGNPRPLKDRVRSEAEPDHNKDHTVLDRGSADHVLVVFLHVLRHQRVEPSRQGAEANTSRITLIVLMTCQGFVKSKTAISDSSRVRSKMISRRSAETSKSPMTNPWRSDVSWRSRPVPRSIDQNS